MQKQHQVSFFQTTPNTEGQFEGKNLSLNAKAKNIGEAVKKFAEANGLVCKGIRQESSYRFKNFFSFGIEGSQQRAFVVVS